MPIHEVSVKEKYDLLIHLVNTCEEDCVKFSNKNQKSCGVRARKQLLAVEKLCKELRRDIIDDIKAIPVKSRKTKTKEQKKIDEKSTSKPSKPPQKKL